MTVPRTAHATGGVVVVFPKEIAESYDERPSQSRMSKDVVQGLSKAYDSSGTRARAFELDVDPFDRDNWILWSKTSTGCGG